MLLWGAMFTTFFRLLSHLDLRRYSLYRTKPGRTLDLSPAATLTISRDFGPLQNSKGFCHLPIIS
jgi:hypothetical protein